MKINGTTVKAPQEITVSIEDEYANEDTNQLGETVKDRISTRRTISMRWVFLTQTEMAAIQTATAGVFFTIEYLDPAAGSTTKTFGVGAKTSPKSLVVRAVTMWDELSMTFKEK